MHHILNLKAIRPAIAACGLMTALAIAVPAVNAPAAPAPDTQLQQEREVMSGKEHEFGDAFIVSLGGKLYDNWWAATATPGPAKRNPAFPPGIDISSGDSWRCVTCHGWDYNGVELKRPAGGKSARFPGLRHLEMLAPADIAERLGKAHRIYTDELLGQFLVDLLAVFISQGLYDTGLTAAAGTAKPEQLRTGQDIFENVCMNCHNPDGTESLSGEPGLRQSLGWLARNRPNRTAHKIMNGVPGKTMLSLRFLEDSALASLLAYLRTLDRID